MYEEIPLTEEELKRVYECRDACPKRYISFALVGKNTFQPFEARGCYAPLGYTTMGTDKCIAIIDQSVQGFNNNTYSQMKEEYKPTYLAYLNWVLNESMWSELFITKDLDDVVKNGAIIKTHYPFKYCIQAAYIIRDMVESSNRIFIWELLRQYMEDHCALILAQHLSSSVCNGARYYQVYGAAGHTAFYYYHNGRDTIVALNKKDRSRFTGPSAFDAPFGIDYMNEIWEHRDTRVSVGSKIKISLVGKTVKSKDCFGHPYCMYNQITEEDLVLGLKAIMRENNLMEFAKPKLLEIEESQASLLDKT